MFVRRGTAGTRMQEIAAEAGVNQALLHYYFRNKEQLAQAAFERAARGFMPAVVQVIASDGELEDKVRRIIDLELDHLSRAPYLPGYIIGEVTHHPERAAQLIAAITGLTPKELGPRVLGTLRRQITARVKAGAMRPDRARVVPRQPDGALHLSRSRSGRWSRRCSAWTSARFEQFITRRREELPAFFLGALRP